VSFGYGLGGTDIPTDKQNSPFGGGGGGGVSIEPLGFIVVNKDKVELLQLYTVDNTTADRVVGMVPEMVDKISALFKKSPADSAKAKRKQARHKRPEKPPEGKALFSDRRPHNYAVRGRWFVCTHTKRRWYFF
jgi:uncharacterized spore protein YtfJ